MRTEQSSLLLKYDRSSSGICELLGAVFQWYLPSTRLPVLLSLESEVFRLQGFVLELVTSQFGAFLPFTSMDWSKDRNVFARL